MKCETLMGNKICEMLSWDTCGGWFVVFLFGFLGLFFFAFFLAFACFVLL